MIYYHPGVTVKTVGFAQGNDSFFSARCLSRTVGIESLPEGKRSTLVSTATRIRGKLRQCINFNATVLLDIGTARIKYYCNIRIFPIFRTRVTYIYNIYIYIIYIYIYNPATITATVNATPTMRPARVCRVITTLSANIQRRKKRLLSIQMDI